MLTMAAREKEHMASETETMWHISISYTSLIALLNYRWRKEFLYLTLKMDGRRKQPLEEFLQELFILDNCME